MEHLVSALNEMMVEFGGVTTHVISDNMRQIVKATNRYEPTFTELIEQWSVHYNTSLLATRVAKPKDKATVEKTVDLVYKRIYAPLRDQIFHNLEELNHGIRKYLNSHNKTLLQRKDFSRFDLLIKERQTLKPLPAKPFELKYSVTAKVQKNYHVTLGQDWHHYSVPYRFIGRKLKIIYDTDVVEIFDGLTRVALHKRNYQKHTYSTIESHMPEKHQAYRESLGWNEEYFRRKAISVGENFSAVIDHLLSSKQFTEQTYNACLGLLRLKEKYGKERLEAASQRARQGSSISYRGISNILSSGMDKEQITIEATSLPRHDNIRGPQHYN